MIFHSAEITLDLIVEFKQYEEGIYDFLYTTSLVMLLVSFAMVLLSAIIMFARFQVV